MQIKFEGLRGFNQETSFVDLKDITILTGKNSSGKSSFLKLIRLIFSQLNSVESLKEIFNININIANEEFGGKNKLLSTPDEQNPKIIFKTFFEFYRDDYEVHVNLSIDEYVLNIKNIQVFQVIHGRNKISKNCVFTNYKTHIELDLLNFEDSYTKNVNIYNECEKYSYLQIEGADENKVGKIDEKIIGKYYANHIGPNTNEHIKYVLKYQYDDNMLPFNVTSYEGDENYAFYHQINKECYSVIPNDDEIDLLFADDSFDEFYEFETYFKESIPENEGININDFFRDSYKLMLQNFLVDQDDFLIVSNLLEILILEKMVLNPELNNKNRYFSLFEGMKRIKHKHYTYLTENIIKIFQSSILRSFKELSLADYLSNMKEITTRSFNIFENKNFFSTYIKNFKVLEKNEKELQLSFLKKYINNFEIADEIEIKIVDNIGFLSLKKFGKEFAVIDEGTGISNILSILLFVAQYLKIDDEDDNEIFKYKNNKYIVLEEPETNLHPNLQSKLADLLVDIQNQIGLKFIIETHSEYLIRKIQYLVSKKMIDSEKIGINYFSLENNARRKTISIKIKKIGIERNGNLTAEFGTGFFDESNNLAIDLFLLNQASNN